MTEAPQPAVRPRRRARRPDGARALDWVALLVLVAAGVLIGPSIPGGSVPLANPDATAADSVASAFDGLPDTPIVLVAMDADMGTYPEIRATARSAFADLLERGASIAFVSVSIEGRAIAVAELDRLRQAGTPDDRLLDLGFVAGAEAGMVRLVDAALRPGMAGPIALLMAQRAGGIGAFDMILVVGGGDIGPRSWVEQVGTRLPAVPMVAIAPTFVRPELAPYLRTGQLTAMLATVRDDAAYLGRAPQAGSADTPPSSLAMLLGMLAALVVLLRQLAGALPRLGSGGPPGEEVEET
jgi:hypothetical protein